MATANTGVERSSGRQIRQAPTLGTLKFPMQGKQNGGGQLNLRNVVCDIGNSPCMIRTVSVTARSLTVKNSAVYDPRAG